MIDKDKLKIEGPPITSNFFAIVEEFAEPGDAEKAFKADYPLFFNPDGSPLDPTTHPNYVPHKRKDND